MKTEDSIILKNQEVGSRITEDLSTYLMRWTTNREHLPRSSSLSEYRN